MGAPSPSALQLGALGAQGQPFLEVKQEQSHTLVLRHSVSAILSVL